ncbi:MAG: S41 family peptidase [Candidatus Aminicenantales bacterium]
MELKTLGKGVLGRQFLGFFLFLILFFTNIFGRQAGPGKELISQDKLRADARQLASILESAHPDPYLQGGRIAFHRRLQEILLAIPEKGLTKKEFYRLLLPFVAALKDGHTVLLPLSSEKTDQPGIPLDFGIVERKLYVRGVYNEADKFLLGARLLAIEGIPLEEIIRRQAILRGYDNDYQLLSLLVLNLATKSGLEEILPETGNLDSLCLSFNLFSGEEVDHTINFPTGVLSNPITPPSKFMPPSTENIDFGYRFVDEKKKIAWLRIDGMFKFRENFEFFLPQKPLWLEPLVASLCQKIHGQKGLDNLNQAIVGLPAATDIFRQLAQEMKQSQSEVLIVDLRKNGGGNSLLTIILAYFLFSPEELTEVLAGGVTIKKYSDLYFNTYQGNSLEKINQSNPFPLQKDDYDFSEDPSFPAGKEPEAEGKRRPEKYLQLTPTFFEEYSSGRYAGYYRPPKIIIVTSPFTYSSGYHLASTFSKLGALVVGVPSGQAGNCFGDTLFFKLNNSAISGAVSFKRFLEYPDDPERGKMLRPDYELTYDKLAAYGFDPNAEILLALEIKI